MIISSTMASSGAALPSADQPATMDNAAGDSVAGPTDGAAPATLLDAALSDVASTTLAAQMEDLQQLWSYVLYSFSLFFGMVSSAFISGSYHQDRIQDDNRSRDEANAHRRLALLQSEIRQNMVQDISDRAAIEARQQQWAIAQSAAYEPETLAA
jgi:hypothetical protein